MLEDSGLVAQTGSISNNTTGTAADVTGIVAAANGGTGLNTSTSSGIAQVSSGTWSVGNTISNSLTLGGTDSVTGSLAPSGSGTITATSLNGTFGVPATSATNPSTGSATITISSTTYGTGTDNSGATNPSISATIGSSGKTLVTVTARMSNGGGGQDCYMSFTATGASAWDVQSVNGGYTGGSTWAAQMGATYLVTGLTSGSNTFAGSYRSGTSGQTCTFNNTSIVVIPY